MVSVTWTVGDVAPTYLLSSRISTQPLSGGGVALRCCSARCNQFFQHVLSDTEHFGRVDFGTHERNIRESGASAPTARIDMVPVASGQKYQLIVDHCAERRRIKP